jgi:hypothetical protein
MSGGSDFYQVALVFGPGFQFADEAGVSGDPGFVGFLSGKGVEGAEAVAEAVLRGMGFALAGDRTSGFGSVGAGGGGSGFGVGTSGQHTVVLCTRGNGLVTGIECADVCFQRVARENFVGIVVTGLVEQDNYGVART